jgi:hypothetical protein
MTERLNVRVKFFSAANGGREQLPQDLLSSQIYRPHLVVGDPNQRRTLVNEKNEITEPYLGVTFVAQEGRLIAEQEIVAKIETIYSGVDYSSLKKGATFTIREGGAIVGNGEVL